MYRIGDDYYHTPFVKGGYGTVDLQRAVQYVPTDAIIVGEYHTHGNYVDFEDGVAIIGDPSRDRYDSNRWSDGDKTSARQNYLNLKQHYRANGKTGQPDEYISFVRFPNGKCRIYDAKSGTDNSTSC